MIAAGKVNTVIDICNAVSDMYIAIMRQHHLVAPFACSDSSHDVASGIDVLRPLL